MEFEEKVHLKIAVFSVLFGSIVLFCLMLLFSGVSAPFISCFAVDKFDRLYIGVQGKILVYKDMALIDTINPKTSRSYMFTINGDDNILLSTSDEVYVMDLNGNVIDSREDPGAHVYNQIQYGKWKFISANGDEYKLVDVLGWTRIVKNDSTTVYQINVISFTTKILIAACIIALVIFVLWVAKQRKEID